MSIKALVFDAYGTLYDVHSVYAKTEELCPGKGDLITQIWRLKQLEYTWLQTSLQDYRDFTFLTHASLEFALRAVGIEPSESITKPLFDKYLDLDPYPEAKDALGKLKRLGGYKLAILSNGSNTMLSALVKNSGLDAFLDATISVDGARKFKPHPDCYALVEKVLGLKNDDVMFVSSNSFDVTGAKHFGFKVAWIRRGGGAGVPADPVLPAQMYRLLRANAETLGYAPDYAVSTLTELPSLL
ncbi:MAG TPA: haloacid dehalogenase type II [Terriglobales bacterium]|nr:haloacid dehalogenase type II [Terriglobales bacterium]